MPALLELQTRFRPAILDDRVAPLAEDVLADGLSVERRVAIYRNNTFILLTDALGATYPVVRRLVDDRFFGYAAHAFITAHPPSHGRLYAYGGGLPAFLDGFAPGCPIWAMSDGWNGR